MCKCTPNIRTPYCGRGTCAWPKPEGTRDNNAKAKALLEKVHVQMKDVTEAEIDEALG